MVQSGLGGQDALERERLHRRGQTMERPFVSWPAEQERVRHIAHAQLQTVRSSARDPLGNGPLRASLLFHALLPQKRSNRGEDVNVDIVVQRPRNCRIRRIKRSKRSSADEASSQSESEQLESIPAQRARGEDREKL